MRCFFPLLQYSIYLQKKRDEPQLQKKDYKKVETLEINQIQFISFLTLLSMDIELKQPNNITLKQALINELLEFGFDVAYVQIAVELTLDKQKAAQILVKLVQEGPNTDLSMYRTPIISQPPLMIPQQGPIPTGGLMSLPKPRRAKMIFIVNTSLKMGKGKICAQVGHGVIGAYLQMQQTIKWDERDRLRLYSWENSGGAKVVLRANDLKQMLEVRDKLRKLDIGINTYLVQDAGHTQIQAGSKTVLAVGPAFSDEIDPITQHLKLL